MRKMQDVRDAINESKSNGFNSAVYVGRIQMNMILAWAEGADYIKAGDPIEGDHRPELEGLKVYEVNADDHFRVA